MNRVKIKAWVLSQKGNLVIAIGKVKLGARPTICAVLESSFDKKTLKELSAYGVRLIELRIDYFKRPHFSLIAKRIGELKKKSFSVIATIRDKKEGGARKLSDAARLELFLKVIPLVDAVDIELKSKICRSVIRAAHRAGKKVIVSVHDFKHTPSRSAINTYFKQVRALRADIFKIAALARNVQDLFVLADFTRCHASKNVIVISMGRAGALSRILFPLRGSLLTYGSTGRKTAPGQFSVRELAETFDRSLIRRCQSS